MTLRDGVLAAKCNGFSNLEIEGNSKIVIDCSNKKGNLPSSIITLMEDVWRLSQDLNIFKCGHIYWETNKTIDYLDKHSRYNNDLNIWRSDFPRDVRKSAFEYYCDISFNRSF